MKMMISATEKQTSFTLGLLDAVESGLIVSKDFDKILNGDSSDTPKRGNEKEKGHKRKGSERRKSAGISVGKGERYKKGIILEIESNASDDEDEGDGESVVVINSGCATSGGVSGNEGEEEGEEENSDTEIEVLWDEKKRKTKEYESCSSDEDPFEEHQTHSQKKKKAHHHKKSSTKSSKKK